MLHYLDDLDSKMEAMRAQFEREAELDNPWTSYNPSLARPLLNTKKFLEKGLEASRVVEAAKPAAAPGANAAEEAAGALEAQPADATSADGAGEPEASPVDALERKFAAHKVTPVGGK